MSKGLYIQMFSVHGLLRQENMELGRDADTGGQILYVVEMARHLSGRKEVARVDLFTRLISDKTVSEDYSRSAEEVSEKFRIIRIQCGGKKYHRKELLWDHLDEYVDKTLKFIKREKAVPDLVHGHYADAGYVCMRLSELLGVPFVFTGHSLGRSKRERLNLHGMSDEEMVRKYKIFHRIGVEEEVLKYADLVITSTQQEIEDQYGLYHNRRLPVFRVIPPGINTGKFYPYYYDRLAEGKKDEVQIQARVSILEQLDRFFLHPDRPIVLTLCRPDKRKNITGLIDAYGSDRELQAMANLAVFAGIRKDIASMEENERDVLTEMLLHMDKYDLYGKMAIPKKHDFEHEVPELYRIAAEKGGVFVNAAMTEPFGLTLIEASSCGLPLVATNDGGPRDILKNLENGILVDPSSPREIADAVKEIIANGERWKRFSRNGVVNLEKHYTWKAHVASYLKEIAGLPEPARPGDAPENLRVQMAGKRLTRLNYFLITDIDNTLIGGGEENLERLLALIRENRDRFGFGVATGRTAESAAEYLEELGVMPPDVIISSVGTEIYYGDSRLYDAGWDRHLSRKWNRERIQAVLENFPFLKIQEAETQRRFKLSYYMDPSKENITLIHDALTKNKLRYKLIYSGDRFLDVLPFRASKGKAIRYLSYKWEIPLENIAVCGDTGNDEEMLRGDSLGIVVGNYSPELAVLRGLKNIYFARAPYAGGILEGLEHYGFCERAARG